MGNKLENPHSVVSLSEYRDWAEKEASRLCIKQLTESGMTKEEANAHIQKHGEVFTWQDFIKEILEHYKETY